MGILSLLSDVPLTEQLYRLPRKPVDHLLDGHCHKLATQHRVLWPGRFLYCCDDHDHVVCLSICLLSKASLLYSNTHIQYISTNNPLARKQSNSITSLPNQQRANLMAWYRTPLFIQSFCLLSRASLLESQHSARLS